MFEEPSQEPTSPAPQQQGIPLPLHDIRVTPVLIGLNVLIFVGQALFSGPGNPIVSIVQMLLNQAIDICTLVFFGAKFNLLIQEGEYWRLVTAMFLHVNLIHLAFNQWALLIFGREVERLFGSLRFVGIYAVSGLVAGLASMLLNTSISAGASGAIFGVLGTQLAFLFRNRDRFGEMGRQQIVSLLAIIGLNIFLGVTVPSIDNWNHMGGLATGTVMGFLVAPRYDLERDWSTLSARVVDVNPARRTLWILAVVLVLVVAAVPTLASYAPTDARDRSLVQYCDTTGLGGLGRLLR